MNDEHPKFLFISLLENFIRETEHSLAYLFALLIFLLTFLLALFGRDALYTGLTGVLCLLVIKMRDIIDGFKGISVHRHLKENIIIQTNGIKPGNDTSRIFPAHDDRQDAVIEKPSLLSYLQTCGNVLETAHRFFPDKPLQEETKQALEKIVQAAQKYLARYLEKKFALTEKQLTDVEKNIKEPPEDAFLFQTRLETAGLDETAAARTVKIAYLLKKLRNRVDATEEKATDTDTASDGRETA